MFGTTAWLPGSKVTAGTLQPRGEAPQEEESECKPLFVTIRVLPVHRGARKPELEKSGG